MLFPVILPFVERFQNEPKIGELGYAHVAERIRENHSHTLTHAHAATNLIHNRHISRQLRYPKAVHTYITGLCVPVSNVHLFVRRKASLGESSWSRRNTFNGHE